MSAFYAWIGELAARGILPSDFQYPFHPRLPVRAGAIADSGGSAIWS